MPITAILGEQRGDEGKGRFSDMLAQEHDIVARFNGGPNAGHTVVLPDGRTLALHLVPSGIAHGHTVNVIGNGTVIDPVKLVAEIVEIRKHGLDVSPKNLLVSSAAHLITPYDISADEVREAGSSAQGTTKSGISQAYANKALRTGLRAEMMRGQRADLEARIQECISQANAERTTANLELLDAPAVLKGYMTAVDELSDYVTDTTAYLHAQLQAGKRLLAEGAQAFLLDIDFGMYPYVTSSSTTSAGIFTGLGLPPQTMERVIGVSKAVQSHVGGGPFPTEITDEKLATALHGASNTVDAEVGTTTGRVRRLGYLDLANIRRAQMINGTTEMALTKLDWVPRFGADVKLCIGYKIGDTVVPVSPSSAYELATAEPVYETLPGWQVDVSEIRDYASLPAEARSYVEFIEAQLGVPITMIGVGPRRDQVIIKQPTKNS